MLRQRGLAIFTLDNEVCRVGQEQVGALHIYLAHHLVRGVEITHERLPYEGHVAEVHICCGALCHSAHTP